MPKIGDGVNR